jgi:ATP-binding cassette subfamily B protein IrtB
MLFDEATSALDPDNEQHVAESIRVLAQHSTVVVIAHKLSTVTAADNIVVLVGQQVLQVSRLARHSLALTRLFIWAISLC